MSQLPQRQDVPPEYRWRLEDLYPDQSAWNKEYDAVKGRLGDIAAFRGRLKDADTIRACFELEDELSLAVERLYVYANMKHHEDMGDPVYQALSDKSKKLSVEVNEALSFIAPEILSLSKERLRGLVDEPKLAKYRHTLEDLLRQKPHVLSESEEALLAQAGNISQAPGTIFGIMNNADLKFPTIRDEHGQEVELTHGRYIQFLESRNRDVRRAAFQAMYDTYGKWRNTFAAMLNANVTKNLFYARARKYPSALEMSLFADNIPVSVYDNLIDTIHRHLPLMYRYMRLRKRMLGVDELHMYDLFAPLTDEVDMNIPYDKAKELVLEGLAPLGEDYLQVLREGFSGGWIDVYENRGKRSGAYSWGAYGTHPYVLLNHKDNLDSVFTLAHEMGHALHSYFSDGNNDYRNAQYPIFLAEVASTLNEALLIRHLLDRTDNPKEKLYLLSYYANQFRTTVFRQTMFAEFEKIIHQRAENGESLTPQELCSIYYDLNKKYYGDDMVVDREIEMEWARIPHFYSSFYVYKYATGFSAATSFARQILEEGRPAVDRYLGFLRSGGSDYPINILKKAGVDMSSPKPIEQAMQVFGEVLDEMEKLTS